MNTLGRRILVYERSTLNAQRPLGEYHLPVVLAVSCMLGCGVQPVSIVDSNSTPSASSNANGAGEYRFDIGVIFADQANYYCLPLSRVADFDSNNAVQSITTSCDCAKGSVVYFTNSDNQLQPAIRIDFDPEQIRSTDERAAPLAVKLNLPCKSGRRSSFVIELLYAYPGHVTKA